MPVTIAFDVYGTLIDTDGVVTRLRDMIGDQAQAFSHTWREKQLEYSFRRGLMQNYQEFSVCTRQALDYTDAYYVSGLDEAQKQALLDSYRTLPAFADVIPGLSSLKAAGHRLYAFSNGTADAVEKLLVTAEIRDYFLGVISVDTLKTFKPNPAVYACFMREADCTADSTWLISGNPFDVIGARSAGMQAAWVKRDDDALFDPWGIEPSLVVTGIDQLAEGLEKP